MILRRSSDIAHAGGQARGQGGAGIREEAEGPHRELLKPMPRYRDGAYRVLLRPGGPRRRFAPGALLNDDARHASVEIRRSER